jgi:hypothetical protein
MKEIFTQCMTNNEEQPSNMRKMGKRVFGPREETLKLIRQFARVYQFEPKLTLGLCSYLVN